MNNLNFENELTALIKKHYGQDWDFQWESLDGGFELILNVFNQPEEID
jgi:hypothetical protein